MPRWPAVRASLITAALLVGVLEGNQLYTPPTLISLVGGPARITQRWKLFPMANRDRFRMWVEARTAPDQAWQLLYRPHDDQHTWLAPELEYRRLRAAWNPGTRHVRGAYPHFVTWVANTTFARAPEFAEVRVRMERLDLDPPTGRRRSTGTFVWDEYRTRAEPRR